MPLPEALLEEIYGRATAVRVLRGEEIFAGTDYPRDWSGFIGQEGAKEQLQVQIASAKARGVRLEHTLIASGIHGVGKSTLATLVAAKAEVGLVATTGPLTAEQVRDLLQGMEDRDILFIDEAHLLVAGNRNKADWILPFMVEGKLYTASGAEKMPDVAILAATTDAGKLPQTLLSRFMVQPTIVPYSPEEATAIALNLSVRMGVDLPAPGHYERVACAADSNPRVMRQILTAVRDLRYSYPDTHPNLDKAFQWAGVSHDGLSQIARDILLLLLHAKDNTQSIESIRAHLGEPGPIKHDEQALMQRGLITVTGRGRKLTEPGLLRADAEVRTRRPA